MGCLRYFSSASCTERMHKVKGYTVPGNQGERERVLKLHIKVYREIAGATWPARKL